MNFLVKDLIKPNNYPKLSEFNFHKNYTDAFNNLTLENPLLDTLFYGPSGSGKFTLILAYLEHIYGPDVLHLTPNEITEKKTKTDKTSKLDFNIERVGAIYTNRYLTIINDTINDDKILDLLKCEMDRDGDYINYLLIIHLDRFKTNTITYLKSFIEKRKSLTCILGTVTSLKKIPQSLKGLMTTYRIPTPSLIDQREYFLNIIPTKFHKVITKDKIANIYNETNGNLKIMIVYINQYLLGALDTKLKKKSPDNYRLYLCYLLNYAIKGDPNDLNIIRSMIMIIYQSPITWNEYITKFISLINKSKLNDEQKIKIIQMIGKVDHQVQLSRLNYCHYDSIIFQLMEILHG